MRTAFDLVVVGAGPAGGEAAIAAARAGLATCLVDEGPAPGGQVWRAPRTASARGSGPDADRRGGDDLRARLAASGATILQGAQVWDARPGFTLSIVGPDGASLLSAPRVVLATGATEHVAPFPGWTVPGVFGLAAATTLMKSQGTLPGRRIAVAGQGPLLVAVASKAIALGLRPVVVIDRNGIRDWSRAAPGFARDPAAMARGLGWIGRLAAARVPYRARSEIVGVDGTDTVRGIVVRPLDGGAERRFDVDTLYVGDGLAPADELLRLLGAAQESDPLQGPRAVCDADRRSSVPGLYVAGDGAGIRGAQSAAAAGRIAGLAAARDHGALTDPAFDAASRAPRRKLWRLARFADASCRLMRMPEASLDRIADQTILCRCEDVTAGEFRAAIADGARDLGQAKHFTRLGMGPCQGRMCLHAAAHLMRRETGALGDLRPTPRAPVRPVELGALIGTYDYDDIPVPKAAPL